MSKKKMTDTTTMYNDLCLAYGRKYGKPEEWKQIKIGDNTTSCMISNYGRVVDPIRGPIPITINNGHFYASIPPCSANGMNIRLGTYRLVAIMFIPVPQKYLDMGYTMDKLVVDHRREGDSDNFNDNTVWNLQWLTHRENTSKAFGCGIRSPFPPDFMSKLDAMILTDCSNAEIYKWCEKQGYTKEEMKGNIQVRRKRLGKTLKEHYEEPKELTAKMDELIKKGLTNDEIVKELNLPDEGKRPRMRRILQYRRSLLGIKNQTSKFLNNEQNEKLRELIISGMKTPDIIAALGLTLSPEDLKKFRNSIASRRLQYYQKGQMTDEAFAKGKTDKLFGKDVVYHAPKKATNLINASSTTIESKNN